ncbi:transposase family protein [Streptomyces phaeochromogenes]|nr:transposase family protein [Streptomyces phaeochromogenes]
MRELGGEHPRMVRAWRLPLAEQVLLVAVYYRTNLTVRLLAVLFGVCPATACRTIQQVGPLLALEPAPRPEGAVERLWIVEGTRIPVRD